MVLNTMTKEVYRRKSGSIVVSEDEKRGHQGSRIRKLRVYIFKLRYEEEKLNWKWWDTLISTPTTSQISLSASLGHQGLPKYHQPRVQVPETMGHISNSNHYGSFISKGPHIAISQKLSAIETEVCSRKEWLTRLSLRFKKLKRHVAIVNWEINEMYIILWE